MLLAPPAAEARRSVPQGFMAAYWGGVAARAPQDAQTTEWGVMARSGVESVRALFNWAEAQPSPVDPYGFQETDPSVERAARRGMSLLPVVHQAPVWARSYPDRYRSPPRFVEDYTAYLRALIDRYGPGGTFWAEHPELPPRPVREWQIWNEPEIQFGWDTPRDAPDAWPQGYVRLLKAAYETVKQADPGARVVAAGVVNDSWNALEELYDAGGGGSFDVAAFHLYSALGSNTLRAAKLVRRVMRRHGDARKPLYATEIGCPASLGRVKRSYGFSTNDRGMARCVGDIYGTLARRRRWAGVGLRRVYWYQWASNYSGKSIFDYSGLRVWSRSKKRFRSRPALGAFQRSARRFEGCAKASSGRCR